MHNDGKCLHESIDEKRTKVLQLSILFIFNVFQAGGMVTFIMYEYVVMNLSLWWMTTSTPKTCLIVGYRIEEAQVKERKTR